MSTAPRLFHHLLLPFGCLAAGLAGAQTGSEPPAIDVLPETLIKTELPSSISDYTAAESMTALKSEIPLLQTPQAITVLERAIIEDQGARKIEDVLRNSAGVSTGGYFQEWDYFRIRGFDVSFSGSYVDGLLTDSSPGEELYAWNAWKWSRAPRPAFTARDRSAASSTW